MGHVFLKDEDGSGQYFMVQECLDGRPFKKAACDDAMISEFLKRVRRIHEMGYALGDSLDENLIIVNGAIRMVDCDYGKHDHPNTDRSTDDKAIAELFGRK